MTTFKVTDNNHPLHGREFEEYTQFKRYNGGVEWIPLLIGANTVKFFALCNLREVRQPNMTDLDYCYPQPCTALTIWRPTLEVTPEMLWRKGDGGIKLVECAHVNVVLTLPEAA